MSRREAVLTIYLLAFCAGSPALFLLPVGWKTELVFAECFAVLALVATMEVVGQRRLRRDGKDEGEEE
jgi:membrane protein implicated in regulation of membrane protease activity